MSLSNTSPRTQRSPKQWQQLIEKFEPTRQTIEVFCKTHGIATFSFYKWRASISAVEPSSTPLFVPLTTQQPSYQPQQWDIELELGHGLVLRINKSC